MEYDWTIAQQKQRENEEYLLRKRSNYHDEKRLGQFNPDVYAKFINGVSSMKSKIGSPSNTSDPSLNLSFANAAVSINIKNGYLPPSRRKEIV